MLMLRLIVSLLLLRNQKSFFSGNSKNFKTISKWTERHQSYSHKKDRIKDEEPLLILQSHFLSFTNHHRLRSCPSHTFLTRKEEEILGIPFDFEHKVKNPELGIGSRKKLFVCLGLTSYHSNHRVKYVFSPLA